MYAWEWWCGEMWIDVRFISNSVRMHWNYSHKMHDHGSLSVSLSLCVCVHIYCSSAKCEKSINKQTNKKTIIDMERFMRIFIWWKRRFSIPTNALTISAVPSIWNCNCLYTPYKTVWMKKFRAKDNGKSINFKKNARLEKSVNRCAWMVLHLNEVMIYIFENATFHELKSTLELAQSSFNTNPAKIQLLLFIFWPTSATLEIDCVHFLNASHHARPFAWVETDTYSESVLRAWNYNVFIVQPMNFLSFNLSIYNICAFNYYNSAFR